MPIGHIGRRQTYSGSSAAMQKHHHSDPRIWAGAVFGEVASTDVDADFVGIPTPGLVLWQIGVHISCWLGVALAAHVLVAMLEAP
jgi:hypothetical protein